MSLHRECAVMRKYALTLAGLVAGWLVHVGPAAAEYVWVRVNVTQIPKVFTAINPGAGVMGGAGMMGAGHGGGIVPSPGATGGGPGFKGGGPGYMGGGPGFKGG